MNNNTILSYPPIICASHEPAESIRSFDSSSYHNYPSHSMAYAEYPLSTSKSETIEYTCWPTIPTHNILSNPSNTVLDQVSPPLSSNPTLDTLGSVSSVHLLPNTLPVQHHQHLYPQPSTSPPSTWIGSGDYQALHSTAITTPPSYRHYSTPCSYYHPQYFYDQPPSQWVSSTSVKFEPSYTPPPSYIESSESLSHCREQTSKEEPGESRQQSTWPKKETSPTHFTLVPPRNPLNGKTRTRDKYRIVYTDQQRYELENEFIMSKYISIPRKSALSLTLSLSERQIKIWFQNRRAKERKLNKKRHGPSSSNQLNNSNDADSRSDGGLESPNCYPNYT